MMKKKMKKCMPLIIFLFVLIGLIIGVITYYSSNVPTPVSTDVMQSVLIQYGLQPVDCTKRALSQLPDSGLENCTIVEKNDLHFEFYVFNNDKSPRRIYQQAYSNIHTRHYSYPNKETEYGKLGYGTYTLNAGGQYSVAIYLKNTAIYAYSSSENQEFINQILNAINYLHVNGNQNKATPNSPILSVVIFILFLCIALIGRQAIWRAVCSSANVSTENKKQKAKLVKHSQKKQITIILLWAYRLNLLPEYTGIFVAVLYCFLPSLQIVVNILGVIIPIIIFLSVVSGTIITKIYNKKHKQY